MTKVLLFAVIACAVLSAQPAASPTFAIVPLPTSLKPGQGAFALTAKVSIVVDAALKAQGRQLATWLAPATGFDLPVQIGAASNTPRIELRLLKEPVTSPTGVGPEGYRLVVTPARMVIEVTFDNGVANVNNAGNVDQ